MSNKTIHRQFTKRLVVGNIVAAWLLLGLATALGQAQLMVTHVLSFVAMLVSIYTGIGHLDYRKFVDATRSVSERAKGDL